MINSAYLAAASVLAILAAPAAAQQATAPVPAAASDGRTTVYQAAFFAQYAPRTALDIAQRVPGFTLDLGATQTNQGQVDVRGFAGTAGNVVINGARPSSKAESLQTALSRIPAQRVVRVEVGPGDLYGSDYAGKSQVLNVVMSEQGGFDANVTAAAKRWYTGYINTDLSASALIRRGASSINLSAGTGRNRQLEEGTDTLTDVATGEVVGRRRKHNSYFNKDPYLSASWALERGSDNAYRFNARWQPSSFDLFQRNRVMPSDGPVHDDNLMQRYRDPVIEVGGDVTRPFAGGAVKFVGLATRRKRDDRDTYLQRSGLIEDNAPVVGGFEQIVKARRNETIGRISWTKADLAGFSFEAGVEGAYNTLDSNVDYAEFDEDGTKVPIDLPIADATVKEKRGEAYVSVGKNLSPALRVDGGVNFEMSDLKVRGDATADRSLKFFKPNLTVDWKPGGGWHAQASIRRTVAQLDFYDFISVADLSADRVSGGNAELQPQRAWEFRATAERPILGDGLFKLDIGHDLVSMVQDRILVEDEKGNKFDAPGNLGTGKRYFASLTLDAPLGRLWSRLRAKFTGTYQKTTVEDPISHKMRRWSNFFPDWQWDLTVRRDAGAFSYGFELSDNRRFTQFRTDEFDSNFNAGPVGTAFVEYRPAARTSITFDVDNLFETAGQRRRDLFFPNRDDPTQEVIEFRERNRHLAFQLTLKQSFGGGGGVAK
ncbi:MAG TPA: outer membrane beta-barrel protein [Sphingomicrobium sp.]|nr:outer membrane beta-barrel protein [Sphingomicrobium sp.]